MSISSTLVIIAGLTLSACANAPDAEDTAGLTPSLAAEFESICGLPAGTLSGKATIPNIAEAGPKVACAVEEARKRNLTIGFISNPVDPDAQTN